MKKTKYTSNLLALIFLHISIVFFLMGCLCLIGIMKPSAHSSVQNPIIMGIVFSMIGVFFCVAQTVFRVIGFTQAKLHNELLEKGIRLMGIVDKVYLQKTFQFGTKSPYRICYTYSYQSKIYHHKSYLLWDKPDFNKGDSIEVYANNLGKSTLKL